MQTIEIVAASAAFVAALAVLAIYHLSLVRPALGRARRMLEVHDELISGGADGAAGRLAELTRAQASSRTVVDELTARAAKLESLAATDVSRIGFVRYNALDDTGSDQSYALALLNREGDGVVLTSIYSRNDTRTYGKAVSGYKPAVAASDEELQAIKRARTAPPTNG